MGGLGSLGWGGCAGKTGGWQVEAPSCGTPATAIPVTPMSKRLFAPVALALAGGIVSSTVSCRDHIRVSAALSPALEVAADSQAHAGMPDGARFTPAFVGVAYNEDEGTSFSVPLQVGTCYTFGYASDETVGRVSLYLFTPANHRADSQRGGAPQGVFRHCANENGIYRLEAKVVAGAGHFVVVGYAKAAPIVVTPVVVAPPPVQGIDELIARQAASAAPGAQRVGDLFVGTGDQSDWYTQLNAGACYWFIGAGDPATVSSLYMYLWSPAMQRITENRSDTPMSMVGYCATVPGMYKFEAKLNKGKGTYKVGVYAK